MGDARERPGSQPPTTRLGGLWHRLGHVEQAPRGRAFWLGAAFLLLAGGSVAVGAFTGADAGALPLAALALVALALGDLSRAANHVASARLLALALGLGVVVSWVVGS